MRKRLLTLLFRLWITDLLPFWTSWITLFGQLILTLLCVSHLHKDKKNWRVSISICTFPSLWLYYSVCIKEIDTQYCFACWLPYNFEQMLVDQESQLPLVLQINCWHQKLILFYFTFFSRKRENKRNYINDMGFLEAGEPLMGLELSSNEGCALSG